MALAVINHHPKIRRMRRATRLRAHQMAVAAYATAQRTPMPTGVRDALRDRLAWQPELRVVDVDKLLLGGQNRLDAAGFAAAVGDPQWASTRVADGPHADLLRRAARAPLSDEEILGSRYAAMARVSIAASGQYFSAHDDAGIVEFAREFIGTTDELVPPPDRKPHQTRAGAPVEVAPIRDSDCYQVIDGHHRVARAAVEGIDQIAVRVKRIAVHTGLQEMLDAMSWIGGEPELYQPLTAPEVATWPTVRGCQDRFEAMIAVLDEIGLEAGSYLDVASCYGWFVAAMGEHGLAAEGVEQDPIAPRLGQVVYGLEPGRVSTGEAVSFLRAAEYRWDVVSCFSLLHHFVLGRSEDSAEALVQALDAATGRVLFLDTGQEHEAWFRDSLAGWDSTRVREFLETETSFDRVVDLGPDQDDRPPYSGNYGRHLFACIRDEAVD
ncbi:hypothetical protein NODU109028_13665 [Nocardioides dubius]|uniref:ParB/Sulfiredoxin domain-containing protein n=1 Tax=Nocardioides dubius TaxID=317019 RepID=A0ABN1TMD5_9ACTN